MRAIAKAPYESATICGIHLAESYAVIVPQKLAQVQRWTAGIAFAPYFENSAPQKISNAAPREGPR
jgi:hypothetical protein